jgi:hypothetical protein
MKKYDLGLHLPRNVLCSTCDDKYLQYWCHKPLNKVPLLSLFRETLLWEFSHCSPYSLQTTNGSHCFLFIFSRAGYEAQGLIHTEEALYHWPTSLIPPNFLGFFGILGYVYWLWNQKVAQPLFSYKSMKINRK